MSEGFGGNLPEPLNLRDIFLELRYKPAPLYLDNIGLLSYSFRDKYDNVIADAETVKFQVSENEGDQPLGFIDRFRVGINHIWLSRIMAQKEPEGLEVFLTRAKEAVEEVASIIKVDEFVRVGLRGYYIYQTKDIASARGLYQDGFCNYGKPPLSRMLGEPETVFHVYRVKDISSNKLTDIQYRSSLRTAIVELEVGQSSDFDSFKAGLLLDIDSSTEDPCNYNQLWEAIEELFSLNQIQVEGVIADIEGGEASGISGIS